MSCIFCRIVAGEIPGRGRRARDRRSSPSSTCSRSPTATCWSCRARTSPRIEDAGRRRRPTRSSALVPARGSGARARSAPRAPPSASTTATRPGRPSRTSTCTSCRAGRTTAPAACTRSSRAARAAHPRRASARGHPRRQLRGVTRPDARRSRRHDARAIARWTRDAFAQSVVRGLADTRAGSPAATSTTREGSDALRAHHASSPSTT